MAELGCLDPCEECSGLQGIQVNLLRFGRDGVIAQITFWKVGDDGIAQFHLTHPKTSGLPA